MKYCSICPDCGTDLGHSLNRCADCGWRPWYKIPATLNMTILSIFVALYSAGIIAHELTCPFSSLLGVQEGEEYEFADYQEEVSLPALFCELRREHAGRPTLAGKRNHPRSRSAKTDANTPADPYRYDPASDSYYPFPGVFSPAPRRYDPRIDPYALLPDDESYDLFMRSFDSNEEAADDSDSFPADDPTINAILSSGRQF